MSSRIVQGDYVPYAVLKSGRGQVKIHNIAGRDNYLIFCNDDSPERLKLIINKKWPLPVYIILRSPSEMDHACICADQNFYEKFADPEFLYTAVLLGPNLKVRKQVLTNDIDDLVNGASDPGQSIVTLPAPVLVVPEAIEPKLAHALIKYLDEFGESKGVSDRRATKSRNHVHPDKALEMQLDDKLSKSVLPEISKVFYSDITHRETYKICSYAGDAGGKFSQHRDTIAPFLHRRYAMSLILNDEYEGGGIAFPEYSQTCLDLPKYSALIFPGSLLHAVNEIQKGCRYVVISFFFGEAEAANKEGSERYRAKVQRDLTGLDLIELMPR